MVAPMVAPMLSVRQLRVQLGSFTLADISLDVKPGDYAVLLGPTGAGKTVLVETLCGLCYPEQGQIMIQGRDVTYSDPGHRRIGYVPQDYALLPFKTVFENIAFGLEAQRIERSERRRRVNEVLKLLGLTNLQDRLPAGLSGGERQRVALGRALVIEPALLVLDEPFSAVDEQRSEQLIADMQALQQRLGFTALHICHRLEEALTLASKLYIMDQGRLVQSGPPIELLTRPHNRFVAGFLRLPNILTGSIGLRNGEAWFYLAEQPIKPTALPPGTAWANLALDTLELHLQPPASDSDVVILADRIASIRHHPTRPELVLAETGLTIPGIFASAWQPETPVYVSFPRAALHVFR